MLHGGGDKDDQQQRMQLESQCCCGGGGGGGGGDDGGGCSSANKLLVECARAMDRGQWRQAAGLLAEAIKSPGSSATGEWSERLAHYVAKALAGNLPASLLLLLQQETDDEASSGPSMEERAAAYLALNQVTPFVRFAHLSANQAILEAVEGRQAVHIIDLGMVHGLQWPPLMQALVERRRQQQPGGPASPALLRLRITGTGPSVAELEQTGWRLRDFAASLGLAFEFDAVSVPRRQLLMPPPHDRLRLGGGGDDEALVVNSMMLLHEYQGGGLETAAAAIRLLSPAVVTVAEAEAWRSRRPGNSGLVEPAAAAAAEQYSPLFESLEATLPPRSEQRLLIERALLGAEIYQWLSSGAELEEDGTDGTGTSHSGWREAMEAAGFQGINPSGFAIAQAKLLLRLHYPSEGYKLLVPGEDHPFTGGLFISWRGAPLFSVWAWRR